MSLQLKQFTEINTGGNCKALKYEYPDGHLVYITNSILGIVSLTDEDIMVGLYEDKECLYNGQDPMKLWMDCTIERVVGILQDIDKIVTDDCRLRSILVEDIKLSDLEVVIVHYRKTTADEYIPDTKTYTETFFMEHSVYSLSDIEETLHRKLGHPNFSITRIYR